MLREDSIQVIWSQSKFVWQALTQQINELQLSNCKHLEHCAFCGMQTQSTHSDTETYLCSDCQYEKELYEHASPSS